ncbi:Subtilisin-like protease SBT5.3 [Hibiscus syriacus]|uniref:Subtilisin-like protease SBT5.3 n=1 Tax=Hibiscus syriacus TaxID=106335 RepID=A0A6A2Z2F7_HIBSY|nr:Subtilisin-like protease SBT5.3 [Hibiscus syriacus]
MQMRLSNATLCLVTFIVFSLLQTPTFASKRSYVVYLGGHSHGIESSSVDLDTVTDSHYDFLRTFLGSHEHAREAIFYSYTRHINGFAANLDDEIAAEIARHPKVVSVFLNKGRKLHTTRSWEFLGLEQNGLVPSSSIWNKTRYGEDTIIGNLDTGVWPESKSFSDDGKVFHKGYAATVGKLNSSFDTPRDKEGHGTHTLSTAGGNMVPKASVFGFDILAAFDVAIHDGVDVLSVSLGGEPTAFFNDSVAIGSFHAIKHGIVVVCSAGNSGPAYGTVSNIAPWEITVGASTMDRVFSSIVVLGNSMRFKGQSLSDKVLPGKKLFPLISAVDAKLANASIETRKDRTLVNSGTLVSVIPTVLTHFILYYMYLCMLISSLHAYKHADLPRLCRTLCQAGAIDPKKATGKILVCLRGQNARVDKGEQAALAGAVGMILANNNLTGNEIIADAHLLPASHINYTNGLAVFAYIKSTKHPMARITLVTTQIGTKPAPFMAAFSSKGPNTITPEILKPDITAPGVSVIAAYTGAEGQRIKISISAEFSSTLYPALRCHVLMFQELLAFLNPFILSGVLQQSYIEAGPFNYGAGHVQPNRAMDPGLVYDLTSKDYLKFLCTLGYNETLISAFLQEPYECRGSISLANFNYPSITIPKLVGSITVTRTVKNVGPPGTYRAQVRKPMGISVYVKPRKLKFKKVGEEKTFKVNLKVKKADAVEEYVYGQLIWSDGIHYVRSPIVVKAA